ncbi:putative DNA polymerase I [Vibrio phage vB_VpS_PG28]|nr:putative DNA polymerase I [Vibrio phage vB_VpS_PG28]
MKNLMQQLDAITQSKSIDELTQVVSGDFSELEARIVAQSRITLPAKGVDIHKKAAMAIFGIKEHEVETRHRNFAKNRNFRYLYSPEGAEGIPLPEQPTHCRKCLDALKGHEDDAYNVCRWCNEGWVPESSHDHRVRGICVEGTLVVSGTGGKNE